MYNAKDLKENPIFKESRKEANPMIFYYKGYYYKKIGDENKAITAFNKGAMLSPDYVFPGRLESFDVLGAVIKNNPHDWKAHYYLGNLLTAKFRWEDGLNAYRKADKINSSYSVLHRNIAQILWNKKKDIEGAISEYEKAIKAAPFDHHLYVDLDYLYSLKGLNKKRINLLKNAPLSVRVNFNVILQESILNVHLEDYDKAINILKENKFHPWEGWTDAHDSWVLASIGKGLLLLEKENYTEALTYFKASMDYPENLGTGKPHKIIDPRAHYLMGLCYEKLGNKEKAIELWEKARMEEVPIESEEVYYRALALKKIDEKSKAGKLLTNLIDIGSKRSDSKALYLSGLGYSGMGMVKEAEKLFKKALDAEPNLIEAKWQLNSTN
ncbi:hypothetical protein ES703_98513 [subsurface metagenome]